VSLTPASTAATQVSMTTITRHWMGSPKATNMWFNLVRACSSCNCSKGTGRRRFPGQDQPAEGDPAGAACISLGLPRRLGPVAGWP
jgi:hypothetical protein